MVRRTRKLKDLIHEFVKKNDGAGVTRNIPAFKTAQLFLKTNPDIKHSVYTVEKYVVHSRAGKIEDFVEDDLDQIAYTIVQNAETASNNFVVPKTYHLEPDLTEGPDFEDPLGEVIDFPGSWSEINEPYTIQGVTHLGVCNDIHLPYHDKSDPEDIYNFFGMSKKSFKMTTGTLYKQRKIEFTQTGIKLLES